MILTLVHVVEHHPIGVKPTLGGSISAAVGSGEMNSRPYRLTRRLVTNGDAKPAHRPLEIQLVDFHGFQLSAEPVEQPQTGIARFVRNESDSTAVRRPSRRGPVELAVGQRKDVAALWRHGPELLPLTAEVGTIHQFGAIRRN